MTRKYFIILFSALINIFCIPGHSFDITTIPEVASYLKDHKVYFSVTSSLKRLPHLVEVLNTLKPHIEKEYVAEVLVALPEIYMRDGTSYDIPENLIEFQKVKILRPKADFGPITKLLPAIKYIKKRDPDSIVVTIDDDIGYPYALIAELISAAITKKDIVVGSSGQNLSFWGISEPLPRNNTPSSPHSNAVPW